MTVAELSQLYYLDREIKANQRRLAELERKKGDPSSSHLTGMPRAASSDGRKVERIVAAIADTQAIIADRTERCIIERARLQRYIDTIPDALTREIFARRFCELESWENVARIVGGGNTPGGVKKRAYRYLKATNENSVPVCPSPM